MKRLIVLISILLFVLVGCKSKDVPGNDDRQKRNLAVADCIAVNCVSSSISACKKVIEMEKEIKKENTLPKRDEFFAAKKECDSLRQACLKKCREKAAPPPKDAEQGKSVTPSTPD